MKYLYGQVLHAISWFFAGIGLAIGFNVGDILYRFVLGLF